MRNVLSRMPWRMGLLWAALCTGLLCFLPSPCQTFLTDGYRLLVGISDDGRSIVIADVVSSPAGGRSDYTGRFNVIDTTTGTGKIVSATLPPEHRAGFAQVAGRHLWIDCRTGDGERRVAADRRSWIDPRSDASGLATLRAIDLDSGETVLDLQSETIGGLWSTKFSSDGTRAMTLNMNGPAISVRDVETGRILCSVNDAGDGRALSADGRRVAIFSSTVRADPLRFVREWRILDADSGSVLAERSEVLRDGPSDRSFSTFHFADGDETLVSVGTSQGSPIREIWRWREGRVTTDVRVSENLASLDRLTGRFSAEQHLEVRPVMGQEWVLVTNTEPTLRDRIMQATDAWLPASWVGISRRDLGTFDVWNVPTGKRSLRIPGLFVQTYLSSQSARLVRYDGERVAVWKLPARWSWGKALLGSVVVPLVWGIRRWKRSPRPTSGPFDLPSSASPDLAGKEGTQ